LVVEGKDRLFCKKVTLNCAGQLIDLSTPKVMGILNVTPDSFHDGGKYNSEQKQVKRVGQMLEEGADMIDIGGYSSRPGAEHVDASEEHSRVIPCVAAIKREFPNTVLSIDTFRAEIARAAVAEGAGIVNDISGGDMDAEMFGAIADLQVPYILMHMRGTPQSMQEDTKYNNLLEEVIDYFTERLSKLQEMRVNDVIVDPGFGFGKSIDGNYQLLHRLKALSIFERPILAGLSRKSMVAKILGSDTQMSLKGTQALNLIALAEGASILRVHDVREGKDIVDLHKLLNPTVN
jgi:dihydropteroate synthase